MIFVRRFWDFLLFSPIALRELYALFRKKAFFISLISVLTLLGAATFVACLVTTLESHLSGLPIFMTIYVSAAILLYLILPAFACTSITAEKEQRHFDLILMSALTPWDVIWGKMLSVIHLGLVILTATLPLTGLTMLYGGVEFKALLGAYGLLLLQIIFLAAHGVYASAAASHSRRAIISCYLGLIVLFAYPWMMLHALGLAYVFFGSALDNMFMGVEQIRFIFWSVLALVYMPYVVLVSLLALNRLKPPQANRSTILRVFFCALIALWLGWMAVSERMWGGAHLDPEWMVMPGIFLTVTGALMLLVLSFEDPLPSSRLRHEGQRWGAGWRRMWALFHPSRFHGFTFVLVSLVLSAGIAWFLIDLRLDPAQTNKANYLLTIFAVLLLHVFWLNALIRVLYQRLTRGMAIGIFAVVIVATTFISLIPHIMHEQDSLAKHHPSWSNELSIASSVILTLYQLELQEFSHSRTPKLLPASYLKVHVMGYGYLALCLYTLAWLTSLRQRRALRTDGP